MSFVSRFSVKNQVAILILVVLVTFGGVYSATRFKQESMPDISIPYLFVTTVYAGATPPEVLHQVTLPLENALKNVEGVKAISSSSANNIAAITLEFPFSVNIAEAKRKVEEALNSVQLPSDAEKPKVTKISFDSGPIMYTAVSAKEGTSESELQNIVKNQIVPALQGIEGVGKVETLGLQADNVYIKLDPARMAEKKVSFQQVSQVLQAMNLTIPLGEATFNKVREPVQLTGRVQSLDELKNLLITPTQVKLQEIAEVKKGSEQRDTISHVQGHPSIAINVVKNSDANTVEVSERVMEQLQKYTKDSSKVQLDVIYDASNDVKKSVAGMAREGLLGALFASLLILLFLRNPRATVIAIVSIPLSIFVAMSLLKYFTNITLNIMTLGGIAVAVGRVVDDSIVVIENIVRRLQGETASKELILDATKEVGKAITSSTITTVAVFAPLGLLDGMVGKIFAPFALTVVFSLLASLLVAVTVVPMLASLLMRRRLPKHRVQSGLSRGYRKLLNWSLNHKSVVLLVSALVLAGSYPLALLAGFTFIPEQKEKFVRMTLTMPKGTEVAAVDEKVRELDQKLRESGKVRLSQVTSGSPRGEFNPLTMSAGKSNEASWIVSLDPNTDVVAFIEEMKEKLHPGVPGATLDIQQMQGGPGGSGVYIIVTGHSINDIREATKTITDMVKRVKGTDNVRNTLVDETSSVEIRIRPGDALKHGLTTAQAAGMLRPFLAEQKIGKIGDGKQMDEIYLSLQGNPLRSAADIENLPVPTPAGTVVRVKDIADVKEVRQPAVLQLRNGQEYSTVTGNIIDKNEGKVNRELTAALQSLKLPAGVQYEIAGSNKEMQDMWHDMGMAILVAIGMVYVVMVVTFGEGRAPFAILFSLPFAAVGALTGTVLAKQPISVASLIGMLMLIGIVVTNAIVLVDRVQQQRENGMTIREALLEAGGTRLRPILMTAIATICALLPLAFGFEEGALISKGLAVVVIGGLLSSTLLTLVIVPIMYEITHRRTVRRELLAARRFPKDTELTDSRSL
ncbi:efflux RND transporter permease subunit [Effusibacillus pohliae]|uniref:efflux RND transporter permease subunit n=1 Tax=Effusibacillus pohliae TaxID=232270 RepID=UPI000380F73E|nr:efflux RND transporter permease subunit [Effusibacillus pohliae]